MPTNAVFTFSCQGLCTTKLEENRSYTYYSTEKLFSPQNIPQQTLKQAKFEPKPCSAHLSCDTWPNECCFSRRKTVLWNWYTNLLPSVFFFEAMGNFSFFVSCYMNCPKVLPKNVVCQVIANLESFKLRAVPDLFF